MSDVQPYQWIELSPLDVHGEMAGVINRRIATHLTLRQDVDSGKKVTNRLRPSTPSHLEALRREVFIWRDIVQLLRFKQLDAAMAEANLKAINDALREAM